MKRKYIGYKKDIKYIMDIVGIYKKLHLENIHFLGCTLDTPILYLLHILDISYLYPLFVRADPFAFAKN